MINLTGKRLLILGGVALAREIVEVAQRMEVYTIVTDYLPDSPAKKIADESFEVSTTDIQTIVALCKEKRVDGVFTSFIESTLSCCQQVCEHLEKPFYLTKELIDVFGEKRKFKQICIKNNVPVPKEFHLSTFGREGLEQIAFPVIIKPVDSSGSRGITVCYTQQNLKKGCEKAQSYSRSGNIIIEEYIAGDEVTAIYVIQDGQPKVSAVMDRHFTPNQTEYMKVPDIFIYPSKYTRKYLEKVDVKVVNMLKNVGLKNGSVFLQACVNQSDFYFYEAGMRLNAPKTYQVVAEECGYNALERMIRFSLTGNMGEPSIDKVDPIFKNRYATLSVLSKPGKIGKIVGLDEIRKMPEVIGMTPWNWEGDTIRPEYRGTLLQTLIHITLKGKTRECLIESIDKVYRALEAYDINGENMLLPTRRKEDVFELMNYNI